jgi:hypothetical protein
MTSNLQQLTVAVTGGARGIGAATVARLAQAGARVVLGDRDVDEAAALAARLGERVSALPLDVTDRSAWEEFAEAAGTVDVLVNNAGIMLVGPLLDTPEADVRSMLEVNLLGVVHGTQVLGGRMAARGRGHLVNVASGVGRVPTPGGAAYSASKFAVVGWSEAAREELGPLGVEVSLVMPTVVRTELATGVPQARFVREVQPEDVAEVIESVVRRPRPETWVPRWTQGVTRAGQLMPRRAQRGLARLFRSDVLVAADPAARAAYERRVREPGG